MKYTITNIQPQLDKNTGLQREDSYGNKRYALFVKDESGQVIQFTKGYRNDPPKAGDILEGELKKEKGEYGDYFKFTPERKDGYTGGMNRSSESPERQASIERQNALTNAVSFLVARAQIKSLGVTTKAGALDELTQENVILIADMFHDYTSGKEKIAQPIPMPTRDEADEINTDDINME